MALGLLELADLISIYFFRGDGRFIWGVLFFGRAKHVSEGGDKLKRFSDIICKTGDEIPAKDLDHLPACIAAGTAAIGYVFVFSFLLVLVELLHVLFAV